MVVDGETFLAGTGWGEIVIWESDLASRYLSVHQFKEGIMSKNKHSRPFIIPIPLAGGFITPC